MNTVENYKITCKQCSKEKPAEDFQWPTHSYPARYCFDCASGVYKKFVDEFSEALDRQRKQFGRDFIDPEVLVTLKQSIKKDNSPAELVWTRPD